MVHWYHAIFSAYGFWLPNDPRGSWSTFVRSYELYKFGPATKTTEKRSHAHDPHDINLRRAAKQALAFPPVRFNAQQRDAIAQGIEQACSESNIIVYACAIGFDHVHVVIARHAKSIEQVVGQFKGRANQQMKAAGVHPMASFVQPDGSLPAPWSRKCWSVFLNSREQLIAAINYVDRHPVKEGLGYQRYRFLSPL